MSYNNYCLSCGVHPSYEEYSRVVLFQIDEVKLDSSYFVPCFCKNCKPVIPAPAILCNTGVRGPEPNRPTNMYPRFRFKISVEELWDAYSKICLAKLLEPEVPNDVCDTIRGFL